MQVGHGPSPKSAEPLDPVAGRGWAAVQPLTGGGTSSLTAPSGFEWRGMRSARPGLGRLLSTEAASTYPTGLRAGARIRSAAVAPAALSNTTNNMRPQRRSAPTAAGTSGAHGTLDPDCDLPQLYRSLYAAMAPAAAGPAHLEVAARPTKPAAAHSSPQSVDAVSAGSSSRTSANGSDTNTIRRPVPGGAPKPKRSDPVSRYQ